MGPIVHDAPVRVRHPRLNRSPEITLEAVGGVIFGRFSNVDNFRPKVVWDVISGVVVEPIGLDVHAKFGDSMSNCS